MNKALQSALTHFKTADKNLLISGRTVQELLNSHERPAYVYSREILDWRHQILRQTFDERIRFTYAVKANPNQEVLAYLGKLYDGLDVASQGEIERGIAVGLSPERMNFAGPGKTPKELGFAVAKGVGSFSIENFEELKLLNDLAKMYNRNIKILFRVNPAYELSNSGVRMGGGPKQFGIDSEKIPGYLAELPNHSNLTFNGLHIYAGTQNLSAESILESFFKSFNYTRELIENTGISINVLNLGGGFGIPYFPKDEELNIELVGSGLSKLVADFHGKFPETTVAIELGRYIVGECGIYVAHILYRKVSRGTLFLILNGGMNHHLAASGNLGQSFHRPMPMTILNRIGEPVERANIAGPLCTSLDKFGIGIELPKSKVGDYLGILNAGAYGYSASPHGFLSHEPPLEIFV